MAMSLAQDGSGFPFFAPPLYQYICGTEISSVKIAADDVPKVEVKAFLDEVYIS